MRTPILLALGPAVWEAQLVAALTRPEHGLAVIRRCTDLADLLGVVGAQTAGSVLVGAGLPRLDRAAVAHLHAAGLHVLGLFDAEDDRAATRLIDLGCDAVVAVGADVGSAVDEVAAELGRRSTRPRLVALPSAIAADVSGGAATGRLVAVWGPVGAPGRTSVAVALADESARAGVETLLVDADTAAPSLAAVLGLCDDVPGLQAAVRRADRGGFGPAELAEAVSRVGSRLRILAGIRGRSCGELRPAALAAVWSAAVRLAPLVVVDVGSDVTPAQDEFVGHRGSAAASALAAADAVVAVGSADPIGLARLVTELPAVREVATDSPLRVVITKVRRGAVGPAPEEAIREALAEHLGEVPCLVPDDRASYDAALLAGRTLAELAPGSPARRSLAEFAAVLRTDLLGISPGAGPLSGRSRLAFPPLRNADAG